MIWEGVGGEDGSFRVVELEECFCGCAVFPARVCQALGLIGGGGGIVANAILVATWRRRIVGWNIVNWMLSVRDGPEAKESREERPHVETTHCGKVSGSNQLILFTVEAALPLYTRCCACIDSVSLTIRSNIA